MKNKKILLLLCVSFILVGCNRNSSSVSSIISNTNSENVTLSSNSSGNTPSISSSYLSESSVNTTSSNEINSIILGDSIAGVVYKDKIEIIQF